MSAALKWNLISVPEYLARELVAQTKHEYLGGVVHAMAGARIGHNIITGNIFASLHTRLRGKKCRPYNSDTKVRIETPGHPRFYYPDVSVACGPILPGSSFLGDPTVIFEVLSRSTRGLDMGEKKDAYHTIPSLRAYVVVEQESALAVVFRRTDAGFVREVYEGLATAVRLGEIDTELPLSEVYDGVEFIPEPNDDDE